MTEPLRARPPGFEPGIRESKSRALPLGDSPLFVVVRSLRKAATKNRDHILPTLFVAVHPRRKMRVVIFLWWIHCALFELI